MLLRLRLVLASIGGGCLLLLLLCLGAQNLDERHRLQLGSMRSVALQWIPDWHFTGDRCDQRRQRSCGVDARL